MSAADWLATAQAEAYAALGGAPCFLRRDTDDGALFASDLPRRGDAATVVAALQALAARGFSARLDGGLLRVDAGLSRYAALLSALPDAPPPLPADDALHPAYALCRLWLRAAPAPLERQPLAPLRCVLKRLTSPDELRKQIPRLYDESAALLRARSPLPRAAGQALAEWLAPPPR